MLDGKLHRGVTGLAGELGHVSVGARARSAAAATAAASRRSPRPTRSSRLLRPAHGDDSTVRRLVELLDAGDAGAHRVVADAGREIGRVLAGLCNVLSPAGVIVGGDLGVAAGASLLDGHP